MKKLNLLIILLSILCLTTFTSCSSLEASKKVSIEKQLNNEKFLLISPYLSNRIFIAFADNRVNGYSGVNRFMGGYKINGDNISMGPLASTMMAGPVEDMVRETYILSVLNSATKVSFNEDVVTFSTEDNQFLKFKKTKK
ncbi:MAG: META domain-containing protein [Fusobacteriaceae bacterium]|jgi:heat shock protein HslJ|nr:META domain-containing protein [Fusobacteriaceae bacterium]